MHQSIALQEDPRKILTSTSSWPQQFKPSENDDKWETLRLKASKHTWRLTGFRESAL